LNESALPLNSTLRSRLTSLLHNPAHTPLADAPSPTTVSAKLDVETSPGASADVRAPVHVVITLNEVSHLHGTGPLVERICNGRPNVFSIRARNDYGGIQEFGDWRVCLAQHAQSRSEFFHTVLQLLRGRNIQTVLCVPFVDDDFLTAIAIQECFGAQLCAYLMDDQNIAVHNVADDLMREFLERCSLRLITHPELRFAYETKYQLPFHILPAIVPSHLVATEASTAPRVHAGRGALVGSFWDQSWFDRLCLALSGCGRAIDWFGNNKSPWFTFAPTNLAKARITAHGVIPEHHLAKTLQNYPFVLVPVSDDDGTESNHGVGRLSLPGRILFALATSHTPILIVGSSRTCGARFVTHFGVGEVVPYDTRMIAQAMDRITHPETQMRMRQRAARIAPALVDRDVADWLARSIELGTPADRRFEDLFAGYDAAIDLAG
jgi:hypothetical protein